MKVMLATMIAAVSALTTGGGTTAPLLDVERSNTISIVVTAPRAPLAAPEMMEPGFVTVTTTTALPVEPATAEPTNGTATTGSDNTVAGHNDCLVDGGNKIVESVTDPTRC